MRNDLRFDENTSKPYLIGNLFEDDLMLRRIQSADTNSIFKEIERLKIENNILQSNNEANTLMKTLINELAPINKVFNSKFEKVKTKQTKEDILKTFRANQFLNS